MSIATERDEGASTGAGDRSGPPLVLVIMDGVGVGRGDEFDAVAAARTPTLDALAQEGLFRTLRAHGTAVGLGSDSDMGNSEVGHNTLGAGRIFDQGANLIDKAFANSAAYRGYWTHIVKTASEPGATLHFLGLCSDGRVHSDLAHLFALIAKSADEGIERVRVHALLDGRDVPDRTATRYIDEVEAALAATGRDYKIASGGGRMVTTMDRYEADWSIVERGWHAHVLGDARGFRSAVEAVETFRAEQPGISDQVLPAFVVADDHGPVGPMNDGDAVVVFNFRGDRAMEITEALIEGPEFDHFDRVRVPSLDVAAMCSYDQERGFPSNYLVEPPEIAGTVSELLAAAGVTQFACAETQKFGHVTYFWNGNRSERFSAGETYVEIPSDRVPFETAPAMKSAETAEVLSEAIASGSYRFLRTNFPGGDMVGHTGDLAATEVALDAIDAAIGEIAAATKAAGGCLIVTADHGNAEDMVERDASGRPEFGADGKARMKTAHSTNPVGFWLRDSGGRHLELRQDLPDAGLANVAATILELLGLQAPSDYRPSLIAPDDASARPA